MDFLSQSAKIGVAPQWIMAWIVEQKVIGVVTIAYTVILDTGNSS